MHTKENEMALTLKWLYYIATPLRRKPNQLCHINLLKPYYDRATATEELVVATPRPVRGTFGNGRTLS